MFTIEIPKRCQNIGKIKYSLYPKEHEYLISPYTTYKLANSHFIPDDLKQDEVGQRLIQNKNWDFYKLKLHEIKPEDNDDKAYWGAFENKDSTD